MTDMLVILAAGRQTYLALYETKADRRRWLKNLTLQMSDPTKE